MSSCFLLKSYLQGPGNTLSCCCTILRFPSRTSPSALNGRLHVRLPGTQPDVAGKYIGHGHTFAGGTYQQGTGPPASTGSNRTSHLPSAPAVHSCDWQACIPGALPCASSRIPRISPTSPYHLHQPIPYFHRPVSCITIPSPRRGSRSLPQAICISRPSLNFASPVSPSPAAFPAARRGHTILMPPVQLPRSSFPTGRCLRQFLVPLLLLLSSACCAQCNIRSLNIVFAAYAFNFPGINDNILYGRSCIFSATGSLPRLDHPDDRRAVFTYVQDTAGRR